MATVGWNHSFRSLWAANVVSAIGVQVSRVALVLYFFSQQDSIVSQALLVALRTLPATIAAPAAGALVDRFAKRSLMVLCEIVRLSLVVAVIAHPTATSMYVMTAFESVASVFLDPARNAAIPLIVDRDQVPRANALQESTANLTMIVGPVLGSELFLAAGLSAALTFVAATFLTSAALIAQSAIEEDAVPQATGLTGNIRAGFTYFVENRLVLHVSVLLFVSILCGGVWMPLAPFFVRDVLGASERVLGWQFGAFGVGGMVGALVAARLASRIKGGALLSAALLVEGIEYVAYASVADVHVSILILLCWGMTVSIIAVTSTSILQLRVAAPVAGRVFAIVKQGENVALLAAMYAATTLGSRLGTQIVLFGAALCYLSIVTAWTLTKPGRKLLLAA